MGSYQVKVGNEDYPQEDRQNADMGVIGTIVQGRPCQPCEPAPEDVAHRVQKGPGLLLHREPLGPDEQARAGGLQDHQVPGHYTDHPVDLPGPPVSSCNVDPKQMQPYEKKDRRHGEEVELAHDPGSQRLFIAYAQGTPPGGHDDARNDLDDKEGYSDAAKEEGQGVGVPRYGIREVMKLQAAVQRPPKLLRAGHSDGHNRTSNKGLPTSLVEPMLPSNCPDGRRGTAWLGRQWPACLAARRIAASRSSRASPSARGSPRPRATACLAQRRAAAGRARRWRARTSASRYSSLLGTTLCTRPR